VIVVEIMGHNAGWLALGAGVAGGADVILIPEIPYDIERVAEAVLHRSYAGKRFSIIALSEGAMSVDEVEDGEASESGESVSLRLARRLEELTALESRVTSLGHLQRGGVPSPTDRLLATRLGTKCAELIEEGHYGVMVAVKGDECVPVKLKKVAGKKKTVPPDHPWIEAARLVGTSFGD
jgi:6-phosphofructokinase 1